jgi:protein required for attachment to host cells
MKGYRTWVLVADGQRGRIYASEAPGAGLVAVGEELSHELPPSREMGTDKPGRSFDSLGGQRHALAPRADWHDQAKEQFARDLAKRLDEAALRGEYDRLVLVAPPAALGELRAAIGTAASERVVAELGKDLTHLAIHELPERIRAVASI